MAKVITKNKAVGAPHFGYTVQIKRRCDHQHRSEEEYGSWSSSFTNTIDRLVKKVDEYPDVTSTLDLPPGTNALVVWAEWSSGDSFGNGIRSNAEAFGIFTDMNSAVELRDALYANNMTSEDACTVLTSDGQTFRSTYLPWSGYFERLENVNIDVVTVF